MFVCQFSAVGQAEDEGFECVEGSAEVSVANFGNGAEVMRFGGDLCGSESAFFVGDGFLQDFNDGFRRDGSQSKELTATEQGRDEIKAGVVGGGSDEANAAGFNIGEQQILLGFVEAVNFVDKENGAMFVVVSGHAKDISQFRRVGEHGVESHHPGVGFGGNDFGEAGLATAGWPGQEDAAELVVGN